MQHTAPADPINHRLSDNSTNAEERFSSTSESMTNTPIAAAVDAVDEPRPLSLTDMPPEVLMAIALQLSCRAFSQFLRTNRHIYEIINSHYIWHQRFTTRFGQTILESQLNLTSSKENDSLGLSLGSRSPSLTSSESPSGINTGVGMLDHYHNQQDPNSTSSSPPSSTPTSPGSSHSLPAAPVVVGSGDSHSGAGSSRVDDDEDSVAKRPVVKDKGKSRKIDLRRTTEVSKELLIELYKKYSRMTLPSAEMDICHMGDRYWKMVESTSSKFGRLAQLQSVWWMDVALAFYGVPPGRYKVQWRIRVTSDAPIINSEFKAILFDKHEDTSVVSSRPDAILFKPRNLQEFVEWTDTRVAKADRNPSRNLFKKGFTVLELPGELNIEDDYQGVFLQIRNYEGWKSGLFIDYARLVNLDDPEQSKETLSLRAGMAGSPVEEEVNDEGEEYYPSSSSRISPLSQPWIHSITSGVRLNPLTFRSRGFRQYNPVDDSAPMDVGARTPPPSSPTATGTGSGSGTTGTSSSLPAGPSSQDGGQQEQDADAWYKFYAVILVYCLFVFWTK
ncbi:hypothetical protein BGZ99_003651 [Dissophora globulifera]|uniref:F-box domain-containing protein n=1 Tax=Dissophora globulifera TaxID=979702 RepID=A0A9P6V0C1_9FUNG|nr:hypothetical protein BGZ99_003651 [Dissophora globulifera]